MRQTQRIALLLGQDIGYCRDVLRGVFAYGLHRRNWVFRDGPAEMSTLAPLREWKPDGIIAHLFDAAFAKAVLRLRKPLVNTTSTLAGLKAPLVEVDHLQVGRLAAEHFLERGFRNFGFFGSAWADFSRNRERGFREALAARGYPLSLCYAEYLPRPPSSSSWKAVDKQVAGWLRKLPKPVAILASNDIPARDLADICRQLELRVPDEVAVLGVDNDEVECRMAWPPLSSVAIPAQRIGYEAAQMLDRLMSGEPAAQGPLFLPPVRVVTRQSTDTFAVADSEVAMALEYIRNHANEPFAVGKMTQDLGLSRRGLERKFAANLGRTLLQEIRRAHVNAAKEILTTTDVALPVVAQRAGFTRIQHLVEVFHRETGMTPGAFRRQSRICG